MLCVVAWVRLELPRSFPKGLQTPPSRWRWGACAILTNIAIGSRNLGSLATFASSSLTLTHRSPTHPPTLFFSFSYTHTHHHAHTLVCWLGVGAGCISPSLSRSVHCIAFSFRCVSLVRSFVPTYGRVGGWVVGSPVQKKKRSRRRQGMEAKGR